MACIDLTVSSDEDDVVCMGHGVDIKLELTKSPTAQTERRKGWLLVYLACISSVSKLIIVNLW